MTNAIVEKVQEFEEANDEDTLSKYQRGEEHVHIIIVSDYRDSYLSVQVDIVVEKRHFLSALEHLTPSVSPQDLARYENLRLKYSWVFGYVFIEYNNYYHFYCYYYKFSSYDWRWASWWIKQLVSYGMALLFS